MIEHTLTDRGDAQKHRMALFDSLMFRRVRNILLVASRYDAFVFEEDGRLTEALYTEYLELNLRYAPNITIASTAEEAIEKLATMPFDLVISILRLGDMDVTTFGQKAAEVAPDVPVLLLAYNTRELGRLQELKVLPGIDRVFLWLGDVRLFVAMIKYVEDRLNAPFDIDHGVSCIILVEDNVRFFSSYLPVLYTELVAQTQSLMSEAVNRMDKLRRMRARPKVLLASSYEEGERFFRRYRDNVVGVVLDAAFPRGGTVDPRAGLDFARMVREQTPDRPVLIQSSDTEKREGALALGANFVDKGSISLLGEVRQFLDHHLGFGDFVFRNAAGEALSRAPDVASFVAQLATVPAEVIACHACRRDVVTWLLARTEFELAQKVRRIDRSEFADDEALRDRIIGIFDDHRRRVLRGVVVDFTPRTFTSQYPGFVRIGRGSLGGKGRGLAFINAAIERYGVSRLIPDLRIAVPPTSVLATDAFDGFMDRSHLLETALEATTDSAVIRAFRDAPLPDDVRNQLKTFIDRVSYPLAVRSSSLLEDASYRPFAGIYRTVMIPNNHVEPLVRLEQLETAVKIVYASVFSQDARSYIAPTPNRLEEEKMAVILQPVVGRTRGDLLYPDIAGVARSHNYYPLKGMAAEDGVASVVLGLGKTVVEGGRTVRFSPRHPRHLYQFSSTEDTLQSAQRDFLALDLSDATPAFDAENDGPNLVTLGLDVAQEHGILPAVGSVYSPENDAIIDGTSRPGVPLVTMAGVLKADVFPLAEALRVLLELGSDGFASAVEIEFAANIREDRSVPHELSCLQIRPVVTGFPTREVSLDAVDRASTVCVSTNALGNGRVSDVRDVIYVRKDTFDRTRTEEIAREIGTLSARLRSEHRPTLLIGPGRWGTRDRWLGIPVKWQQIAGVKCIVETEMEDISVEPSQGTHFFQNITSFGISYFSVNTREDGDEVNHAWLDAQPAAAETGYIRHLAFDRPLEIVINGRRNLGAILKPGCALISSAD